MRHPVLPTTLAIVALSLVAREAEAHPLGSLGAQVMDWHTDQVARVISQNLALGTFGRSSLAGPGAVVEIEGRQCLRGSQFSIDVRDDIAFDIDETVQLELELAASAAARTVAVAYDKNGSAGGFVSVNLAEQDAGDIQIVRVDLDRARFAGRGDFDTDLMILAGPNGTSLTPDGMTICGINVVRSFQTQSPKGYGWLDLSVFDEDGVLTPARLGLYDESGRTPLPASSAVEAEEFDDRTRMVLLRSDPGSQNWPSDNRWIFYTHGEYRARLPIGRYSLVVSRGIEYRIARETVRVEAGDTEQVAITMNRWIDLPDRGWYSGDVHIHRAQRDGDDSQAILVQAQAEDLHVANALQMGNMGAIHYPQRVWGPAGRQQRGEYTVVPGQEDPRTRLRGHTIHLDIPQPVRNTDRYLLYHEVFERVSELGGTSGYAHIGGILDYLGGRIGLALEVPYGYVDFVEVLQAGGLGTGLWFDFLNLGFQIAPAAGSDYPYAGHVGEVRTYVNLPDGYGSDAWFKALAAGRTFVTNGPVVDLEINGAAIGARLALSSGDAISISAEASINPDVDLLEKIELIEQGEVVAESTSDGAERLQLEYETIANHGTWFVLRAVGRSRATTQAFGPRAVEAITAPTYLSVDGQRTWKQDDVVTLAEQRKAQLNAFARITAEGVEYGGAETWQDGAAMTAGWDRQLELLSERIDEAKARYDELIELAE